MSLKRKTLKHTVIYSVADMLGKLVSFLLLPFYARVFDTEGYGIVALVDSSIGLLSIAFSGCAYNAFMRIYHDEPEDRKHLAVGTAVWTMWALGLICIPIPALASPWIAEYILGEAGRWPIIVVALATFVISTGGQSAGTLLVIRQQSTLYSALGLLYMVLGLSLNMFFVLYLRVGVIGVFWSSLIVATINSLIVHIAAIRQFGLHYDREVGRKLRAFWFPLIPGEFFAYISRQAERYLVRFMIGLDGVGILEVGYKFAPLLNIVVAGPFLRAWGTTSMEIGSDSKAPKEIASTFTLYMFLVLFGAVFLSANIDEVLALLTPPQFWPAGNIARIETVTTVIVAAWNYLQFGLLYRKLTSTISRIRIITSIFKIALSYALIVSAGLAGAAYSALLMQVIITAWTFSKAQSAYYLPLEFRKLAILVAGALATVLLARHPAVIDSAMALWISEILREQLGAVLALTSLAVWRSGLLVQILNEQSIHVAKLLVSSSVCILYGTLIVVAIPNATGRLRNRLSGLPLSRQTPGTMP